MSSELMSAEIIRLLVKLFLLRQIFLSPTNAMLLARAVLTSETLES